MTDAPDNAAPCPVCGAPSKFAYSHPDLEIRRCTQCGHAFTALDTMRTTESYSSSYYDDEHKNWFENPHTALFQWISDNIPSDAKSVVDIGCGRGDFLRHLHKLRPDLELVGIDLSPNTPEPGITYHQNDIMTMDLDRQFDVVVSLAAVEHMEAPLPFAQRLKQFCNDNGVVVVMTVNESGLLYRTARLANRLGASLLFNRLYSAHHLNHFSVKSLNRLLSKAGLSVEKTHHHNSPLAAVDLPENLRPLRIPVLAILAVFFALGSLTSMCLSQTVVARPKP